MQVHAKRAVAWSKKKKKRPANHVKMSIQSMCPGIFPIIPFSVNAVFCIFRWLKQWADNTAIWWRGCLSSTAVIHMNMRVAILRWDICLWFNFWCKLHTVVCVDQILMTHLCPPFRVLLTSIKRIKLKTTFYGVLFSQNAQRSVSCWFSTVNFHLNAARGCAASFVKEIEFWMSTPTSITLNSISWREATKTFSRFTRYVQFHNATFFFFLFLHINCVCVFFSKLVIYAFFPPLQSVCEPQSYRPMHHEDYKEDLRKFRLKSRTWAGERSKRDMYSRLKKLWDSRAHNPSWFYCLYLLKCCPHTWDMAETWRGVLDGTFCESVWYWFSTNWNEAEWLLCISAWFGLINCHYSLPSSPFRSTQLHVTAMYYTYTF